ncbi:ankyrin repeat domain-containing protein [Candidatus Dependentiae bacterium]|nr:ankyrin repeat domain-containing protein [Candidatus Dependentiae bacterium]
MYKKLFLLIAFMSTANLFGMEEPETKETPEQKEEGILANKLINAVLTKDKGKVEFVLFTVPVDAKNIFGETALMVASKNGLKDIVRILIKAGANVYKKNYIGLTALDYAKENGHTDIVKILREAQKK